MAENYTVNYNINVNSAKAQEALTAFQTATAKLTEASKNLTAFQKKIDQTIAKFNQLAKKTPALDFKVANANKKLQSVITKLQTIERLAKKVHAINVTTTTKTGGRGSSSTGNGRSRGSSTVAPITGGTSRSSITPSSRVRTTPRSGGSPTYRALGPTMIDSGGISAIDMLKGMGIAYGITGLGGLMGSAISSSVAYDNVMQTARNILGTHDKNPFFNERFNAMERNVRNVGKMTKFTVEDVANATRFLAMAGLDIDTINKSIEPIANIALVGDTDLGETADLVTNIMTGYGMTGNEVRRATDIMTMTFTAANTTLTEIAEAYKYSASLLHEGGVSFEEATAAMGVLGNVGIKGSQAGTSMRTILANIINPRSIKRDKAWQEVGVERFDENGKMRNLSDIFQDLHDKNLDVSMYYRLFDRTAAQGAVSLAANVDVWNDIIRKNFMSDSLAERLANEKENTIQGLWDKLTSAFEDKALEVFESNDSTIRGLLNDLIDWVDSDEMLATMKNVAKALMDFIRMIVDFTKRLIELYNRFEGFIKMWIELQLKISMVLIPLRAVRSLLQFGEYVGKSAKHIGELATQFGILRTQLVGLTGLKTKVSGFWGEMFASGYVGRSNTHWYKPFKIHQNVSQDVIDRYNKLYKKNPRNAYIPAQITSNIGFGVGSIAGGALGAWAGSSMFGTDSGMGMLGTAATSIVGSALGAWGFSKAISGIGVALGALSPIVAASTLGIGALALGLGYGAYKLWEYHQEVDKATEAHHQFLASTQSINGINYSEAATKTDKYLQIVYNKQLSVNQALAEYIKLRKEELGLIDDLPKDETKFKDSDKYKELYANASKPFGFWSTDNEAYNAVFGDKVPFELRPRTQQYMDKYGRITENHIFNGVRYLYDSKDTYSQMAAAQMLYAMGQDISEGTQLRKVVDQFAASALSASSLKDMDAVLSNVSRYVTDNMPIIPGSYAWDMDKIGENTVAENMQGYHYVKAFEQALNKQFDWQYQTTALGTQLHIFREILKLHEENKEIGNELLQSFLAAGGVDPLNLGRNYGAFGSDQFLKNFGFNPNTGLFEAFTVTDKDGKQWSLTAQQARDAFLSFHQQIIDIVNRLNPRLRSYFDSFVNSSVWNVGNPEKGSDTKTINGITYKMQRDPVTGEVTWIPVSGSGWGVAKPMTDAEMTAASQKQSVNNQLVNNGNNVVGTGGKANSADYKSHYNNGNAAPKQVIVRIDKLMNVESVDLSNPDNAAVISNLKGQLAQALIDVVHDFDETWHG